MPATINVGTRRDKSLLDTLEGVAGGVAAVGKAAGGVEDVLNRLNAPPADAKPGDAEAQAKTAVMENKPLQSEVGGTLGNAMTRRYKELMETT